MGLRDYQLRAVSALYQWMTDNPTGHPCLVMPTGSGKSWIIAEICRDALQAGDEPQRVLMLTHVQELIQQNAEKLRQVWPNAPLGIYSASLGRRELYEPITFGGIQSLRKRAKQIGHVDLILVDECHLISHEAQGGYRTLIAELTAINPRLTVIGLTATPYRLGHGYITDAPAIFSDLIDVVTIEELIAKGHLAELRSKVTATKLDAEGVARRGGEYIESQLQAAVDTEEQNAAVVDEIITRAGERKAWLIFCAGVRHAEHVRDILRDRDIVAECVTGETPQAERRKMLADYKAGRIRALTNANVLTTGFDYPDVDLLAFLRPTLSTSLYVQMAGRGMRPKSRTDHCLVLDFAGNVERHGPIVAVKPPRRKGEAEGDAPSKVCGECGEICHASVRECPACGAEFPPPKPKALALSNLDIMGRDTLETMAVESWRWVVHEGRSSGVKMLRASYIGRGLSDPIVDEYFTVLHEGAAGHYAWQKLARVAGSAKAQTDAPLMQMGLEAIAETMARSTPPAVIDYARDGKYYRVAQRRWEDAKAPEAASAD